jgi:hypothetical protein
VIRGNTGDARDLESLTVQFAHGALIAKDGAHGRETKCHDEVGANLIELVI